jgi:hypothetical protein
MIKNLMGSRVNCTGGCGRSDYIVVIMNPPWRERGSDYKIEAGRMNGVERQRTAWSAVAPGSAGVI